MSTPLRRYYRGTNLVAMRDVQAGATSYYHFDHQGTTQCLTNSAGTVTDRFASDAWGVQVKRTGSSINRQWYIGNLGYYRQKDQMLDYVRARYLDLMRASWLSHDPKGPDPLTLSVRGYARLAPAARVDPTGLRCRNALSTPIFSCEADASWGSYLGQKVAWIKTYVKVVFKDAATCDPNTAESPEPWTQDIQYVELGNTFHPTDADWHPDVLNPNSWCVVPDAIPHQFMSKYFDAPGYIAHSGNRLVNCPTSNDLIAIPVAMAASQSYGKGAFAFYAARFRTKHRWGWAELPPYYDQIASGNADTGWHYWHICIGTQSSKAAPGALSPFAIGWDDGATPAPMSDVVNCRGAQAPATQCGSP